MNPGIEKGAGFPDVRRRGPDAAARAEDLVARMRTDRYHASMADSLLPSRIEGVCIHMVGIKGTGMAALAEILSSGGARLTGSDVPDVFYTDAILASLGIKVLPFSGDNIRPGIELVIHSAAYPRGSHPELIAAESQGIPILTYTEALGELSRRFDSSGISGVHGKTTTTAMTGTLLRGAGSSAMVLAGSAVAGFGDRSTLILGNRFFVAETCEYKRHFLSFSPARIVLTSVEPDHQDYYPDYDSIRDAFLEYVLRLPSRGCLIYCADDPGASDVARRALGLRPDLDTVPYGWKAEGKWRLESYEVSSERAEFRLSGFPESFRLRIPGRHAALDAAAALALTDRLVFVEYRRPLEGDRLESVRQALEGFSGSRRRCEILGTARGVLFMDDYGHHPTAIRLTLEGLREFYPRRRLVVDFMSHTYSRTAALLDEYADAFPAADLVILHKIYASAREKPDGSVTGRTLFERMSARRPGVRYFEEPLDALDHLLSELRPGDLFLTLGAGDNFRLGKALYERIKSEQEARTP